MAQRCWSVRACSNCTVIRTRLPDRKTLPWTIAAAFSSSPIVGRGFLTLLYRMIEVREITRKGRVCANPVISASVIPSAKYTLFESRERFSSGNTAIERIAVDPCFAKDGDGEALNGF